MHIFMCKCETLPAVVSRFRSLRFPNMREAYAYVYILSSQTPYMNNPSKADETRVIAA